jgi:hypothetical protein
MTDAETDAWAAQLAAQGDIAALLAEVQRLHAVERSTRRFMALHVYYKTESFGVTGRDMMEAYNAVIDALDACVDARPQDEDAGGA